MSGLARILVMFGLSVLGVALILLWRDHHTGSLEQPSTPVEQPRVGRSTLSHGGPGVSDPQNAPAGSLKPARNVPPDQPPQASMR